MRFPYHKYLGPGNSLNLGKPIDEDDRIALVHDIHYSLLKSNEDIRRADEESILEFYKNFLTTGNWHSLIGDNNIDTAVVENTINTPITGSSFANRHNSGKSGNVEDRAVPNNEYNFDSIFHIDDSEMDIKMIWIIRYQRHREIEQVLIAQEAQVL
ncbi:hypothetical protein FQA39_LY15773 [Lamprigera yunnana]|nr:hypothetical protein FQA39_LY15773 [Lamprigera yunnana]